MSVFTGKERTKDTKLLPRCDLPVSAGVENDPSNSGRLIVSGSNTLNVNLHSPEYNNNNNNSPISISGLNERSNTCPQIVLNDDNMVPAAREVPSMSLPNTNSTRKSFFGELKNLLTFKKKDEHTNEIQPDIPNAHIKIEADINSQLSRRKQVFTIKEEDEEDNKTNLANVTGKISTLQMSIKKWKIMKNTEKEKERDTIAVNAHHQKLLDECVERLQVEVPFPLHIILTEEALRVAIKTHQMYNSMLGRKHKLTIESKTHIARVKQTMYTSETY